LIYVDVKFEGQSAIDILAKMSTILAHWNSSLFKDIAMKYYKSAVDLKIQ
jgi:hypothetical protein